MSTAITKKRFLPLDILRGLAMIFMIIANNPGSAKYVYAPLRHAAWDGCTPTDVVFPVFLFCMGMAMAWSLAKFGGVNGKALLKIFKRGVIIFALGLFLNLFPSFDWANMRWFGVLQRIACCYVLAAVLVLALKGDGKRVAIVSLVLLVVYSAIMLIFGKAGAQFTLEGNVCGRIDSALVGGKAHMYKEFSTPVDPCGPIGTLSATVNVLLGFLAGKYVKRTMSAADGPDKDGRMTATVFAWGVFSLLAGEIVAIWIPVNKTLWTASYVLLTNGWAMISLAVIMYLTNLKGHAKWFEPARMFGTNALVAYFLSCFGARLIRMAGLKKALAIVSPFWSLVYALVYTLLIWLVCLLLYKKKIFIKL